MDGNSQGSVGERGPGQKGRDLDLDLRTLQLTPECYEQQSKQEAGTRRWKEVKGMERESLTTDVIRMMGTFASPLPVFLASAKLELAWPTWPGLHYHIARASLGGLSS